MPSTKAMYTLCKCGFLSGSKLIFAKIISRNKAIPSSMTSIAFEQRLIYQKIPHLLFKPPPPTPLPPVHRANWWKITQSLMSAQCGTRGQATKPLPPLSYSPPPPSYLWDRGWGTGEKLEKAIPALFDVASSHSCLSMTKRLTSFMIEDLLTPEIGDSTSTGSEDLVDDLHCNGELTDIFISFTNFRTDGKIWALCTRGSL